MGHTPRRGAVKQRIEAERAALDGPLDPLPAPVQVRDKGKGGASETPLAMDELASAPGDEHHADEVRGPRRQATDEVVNSVGRQINWRGSQVM